MKKVIDNSGFGWYNNHTSSGTSGFAGSSYTPPIFDFYIIFKKECFVQQTAASSPLNVRRKVEVERNFVNFTPFSNPDAVSHKPFYSKRLFHHPVQFGRT